MRRLYPLVVALLILIIVSGCATLPSQENRMPSVAITDTGNTMLAQKWLSYEHSETSSDSGMLLLPHGLDAFVARATLSNVAMQSIDVQYYLWHDDLVGLSLLALLKQAADRGVRVRMLLDDIDLKDKDKHLAALNHHPSIEIRVFNPFSRRTNRGAQYVTRLGSVTRRMHNKSFTVDNQATIIGGRNIGNEYFEADPNVAFGDLDALAIGPVVAEISNAFDAYWNSELSYPVHSLVKNPASQEDESDVSNYLDQFLVENDGSVYALALKESPFIDQFLDNKLPFEWGSAQVIVDHPEKISSKRTQVDLQLSGAVSEVLSQAENELIIFSPYFIPGVDGSRGLIDLAQQGVKVRVVTNSLASNNHRIVHAKYANYRKRLLEAGIDLYEIRAEAELTDIDTPFGGSKETVLHAKSFVVDREKVFIGSLNFDPRSFVENTEIGVVFSSEEIASEIGQWFDENILQVSYHVSLESSKNGTGRLVWQETEPTGNQKTFHREPDTTWWTRFKVKLMSFLPVESQL